ncbi:3-oxoacyl-[acyl-carrier-protein] synthase-3 [Clostridium cavendishii DSM 21758]|uniref:3-oxoacyl-[acyl-carrier-protein] synthase-3 n=1 Tax=Clostridium cavendishii DSM 21758 TaxID=1121302 RepID=A0A1M6CDI0_9CLOT|nr:3-oxoacyl-[acyl-carrier-protein] synthase III C-terminal domain-containing protein [Clostridium cavendishii]SHI58768.1 3-oxoacyl-[acyl-carrier-protein] synthase-3 [Clostridium cavendishii DSM 21758]
MSYISYLDYYMPKTYEKAEEILKQINDESINIKYMLNQGKLENISVENELNNHEMIFKLMDKYIESNNSASDFDAIIFQGADRNICNETSIPYVIIEKYNMNKATVFALNQECSTTLQAIELADGLINSNKAKKVLIASICRADNVQERYVFPTILGDGAGLIVIENQGKLKILDSFSRTDGTYSYKKYMNIPYILSEKDITINIKNAILKLLENNKLTTDDVKFIVPQNVNEIVYRLHAKVLKISPEKFFLKNIPFGGHVGDIDTIRNLKDIIDKNLVFEKEKLVLFAMGMIAENQTYVSILIEKN